MYSKRRIFIVAAIFALVVVILSVIYAITYKPSSEEFNDGLYIENYDETVDNLPNERKEAVMAALYNMVEANSQDKKDISSSTAVIRAGSNHQEFNSSINAYFGSFIVDIERVRQSYIIYYTHSDDESNTATKGYPVVIRCLPTDKLIYEDFNCKDLVTTEAGGIDSIANELPYSTLDYEISAVLDKDNNITINVRLFLSEADYRTGSRDIIEKRKKDVEDWFRQKGFNPEDYIINYNY